MKLLSWLALFAVAQSSPTDEWVIDGLQLSCGFETNTILSFEIYPGDATFDKEHIRAGQCDPSQLQISNSTVPTDLPEGKTRYNIMYNAQDCMGNVGDRSNLESYASNITFGMDFGYIYQQTFMHFKTYNLPVICKFQSSYSLKYEFGGIAIPECTGDECLLGPITGGIDFELSMFSDSARTNELLNNTATVSATDMVYFTISPKFDMPVELQFAPPKCRFLQETCNAADECNVHNEFDLFNYEENSCNKDTLDSPLHFQLTYEFTENKWDSQFRVFLFPGDVDQSTYTLRCDVDVCAAACSEDSAIGDQKCQTIAADCLSESSYQNFNGNCLTCNVGQQLNDAGDSCEDCPVNTFNDNGVSFGPCQACPDGQESEAGQSVCVTPCGAGTQLNTAGDGCEDCPANTYSNTDSITPCIACDAGFVSDTGASECTSGASISESTFNNFDPATAPANAAISNEDILNTGALPQYRFHRSIGDDIIYHYAYTDTSDYDQELLKITRKNLKTGAIIWEIEPETVILTNNKRSVDSCYQGYNVVLTDDFFIHTTFYGSVHVYDITTGEHLHRWSLVDITTSNTYVYYTVDSNEGYRKYSRNSYLSFVKYHNGQLVVAALQEQRFYVLNLSREAMSLVHTSNHIRSNPVYMDVNDYYIVLKFADDYAVFDRNSFELLYEIPEIGNRYFQTEEAENLSQTLRDIVMAPCDYRSGYQIVLHQEKYLFRSATVGTCYDDSRQVLSNEYVQDSGHYQYFEVFDLETRRAVYGELMHGYHISMEKHGDYILTSTFLYTTGNQNSDRFKSINVYDLNKFLAGEPDSRVLHIPEENFDDADFGNNINYVSYSNGAIVYGPTNNNRNGDIKYFDITI